MNSKLRAEITKAVKSAIWFWEPKEKDYLPENAEPIIDKAEKAIRQAVGEEMLELIGEDEHTDPKRDPGYLYYKGRNDLRAELRQKIKQWQGGEE